MKKITILFILAFLAVGLFADPKFPKYDLIEDNTPYVFVSNDCQNVYSLCATKFLNGSYSLHFYNRSLILPTAINIEISFSNEKKFNDFIKDIDLSNIEESFMKIRQNLIKQGITPDIFKYNNGKPTVLTREDDNTIYGYGYNEDFDFQTIPSSVLYRASF